MTGASFYKAPIRVMGGCDGCNSVQEMREVEPGVWVLNIMHEEHCPTYCRIVARRTEGKP